MHLRDKLSLHEISKRLGGVPRRGIYDNIKTAVDKVDKVNKVNKVDKVNKVNKVNKGRGRIVNARFAVMCAHYLFDADFCNVASGWGKGVVEKNVQDNRRRIWIEAQTRQFASFIELNVWLGQRCRALWGELRHPEYPALSVADMLEQEPSQMMPMPMPMPMPTPFDGYVERPARVSSTCLVTVSRNRYSVPCELAGQMVSTRLYPGGVSVVASHERVAERGQVRYDWEHYMPLVQRKPGGAAQWRALH
ncbi:hypothetical protein L1274_004444 [Duganella sp. HSC-15S17]|uniref:Transposase for insertion sequence element IS21-like C-terminal domain-containing protein n=1 Tax=Duganella violaceipulchra TaxID=2849652 RepID=A0ABT1GNY7_9BURK|nr:hypothetical protein [Duganella violaceicalia]